jgi:hypothetical protein
LLCVKVQFFGKLLLHSTGHRLLNNPRANARSGNFPKNFSLVDDILEVFFKTIYFHPDSGAPPFGRGSGVVPLAFVDGWLRL